MSAWKIYKCPKIITGATFILHQQNFACWIMIMRYSYCLQKSLLQMNLQTYLNYCTPFNKLLSRNYCNLGKLSPLNCLACKFFTIVCSSSDLVVSVSVWRCGHLLVLLLSKEKVQYTEIPYINSWLYRPAMYLSWLCRARHDLVGSLKRRDR